MAIGPQKSSTYNLFYLKNLMKKMAIDFLNNLLHHILEVFLDMLGIVICILQR